MDELQTRPETSTAPKPHPAERPRIPAIGIPESLLDRVAGSSINVLVLGETGVGKEVLARRIHESSKRAAQPCVRLNCAALSESLIESELFGHERGAFTGATTTKPGLLETAAGGTVFLDEIGEMPLSIQSKLLRVIDHGEMFRVGAVQARKIDVRFVAATNRDLEFEVTRGGFRRDLFFRLAAAILRIPPLRERTSEIPGFVSEFLSEAATPGSAVPGLSRSAMRWLEQHPWPGNLRELRNTIQRALLFCDGPVIEVVHLSPTLGIEMSCGETARPCHERVRLMEALVRHAGNQSAAARDLGIGRNTLMARLDKYGLPRPRRRL